MSSVARFLPALILVLGLLLTGRAGAEDGFDVPVERWTLANGAEVLYVHRPQLPMMSLRVVFDAGSARDPKGRFGTSALTARLLDEGTEELTADELARRLDERGIELSTDSGRDTLALGMTTLTEEGITRAGWDLARRILTRSAFRPDALARERGQLLTAIRRDREKPRSVALKAFWRTVYGDHPYAHPTDGVPEQIQKIGRADLRAFAGEHLVGRNATIAVVGSLDRERVEALLAETLGQLPPGSAQQPLPAVASPEGAREVFVRKDVSQAHILMGQPAARRGSADYFPLLVGNYSLGGGGFTSRLMSVVREEHGLSYSVFSTFAALAREGPFVAGLQTANAKAPKALELMRSEVDQYLAEGPTADELEGAHRYLTGSFPLKVASNGDIVSQLTTMGFYGLDRDYLDRYRERVSAVTSDDIRRALGENLDARAMVTVIVGAERPEGFGDAKADD